MADKTRENQAFIGQAERSPTVIRPFFHIRPASGRKRRNLNAPSLPFYQSDTTPTKRNLQVAKSHIQTKQTHYHLAMARTVDMHRELHGKNISLQNYILFTIRQPFPRKITRQIL